MIVIGGLVLAFSLVALVVLLNTILYTENVSSKSALDDSAEIHEIHDTLRTEYSDLIYQENTAEHSSQSSVDSAVHQGVAESSDLFRKQYGTSHASVQTTITNSQGGALVRQQNQSREYVDKSGLGDWHLGSSSEVRRFQFQIDNTALPTVPDFAQSTVRSGAFYIYVAGANGEEWRVYFARDPSGDFTVLTQQNNGPITIHSYPSFEDGMVSITSGTVTATGETDDAFEFAPNVDQSNPYDIYFRNGNLASGSFETVVNTDVTGGAIDGTHVNSGPGSGPPYEVPAVYSLELEVSVTNGGTSFADTLRVAPDAPRTDTTRDGIPPRTPRNTHAANNTTVSASIIDVTSSYSPSSDETDITVDWKVTSSNSSLHTVTIMVTDITGSYQVKTVANPVHGTTADSQNTVTFTGSIIGDTFDVVVIGEDQPGNTAVDNRTHTCGGC